MVDLSLKEEPLGERNMRFDDQIRENEEEEGALMKNVPNATNQKESSPFKLVMNEGNHESGIQKNHSQSSYTSSPHKNDVIKSSESMEQMIVNFRHDSAEDLLG